MTDGGDHKKPPHTENGTAAEGPQSPPAILLWFDKIIRAGVVGGLVSAGLAIVAIVLLGSVDTAGRAFFNQPFMGTVEITEALLAAAIFLALAYAQQRGEHVAVDLLTQSFGPKLKRIVHFVALVLTLLVFGLLFWRSSDMAQHAWRIGEVSAGYLPVPVWIAKIAATFGIALAVMETLRELIWLLYGRDVQGEVRAAIQEEAHLAAYE